MGKLYVKIVEGGCCNCPLGIKDGGDVFWCGGTSDGRTIRPRTIPGELHAPITDFPSWCPLHDAFQLPVGDAPEVIALVQQLLGESDGKLEQWADYCGLVYEAADKAYQLGRKSNILTIEPVHNCDSCGITGLLCPLCNCEGEIYFPCRYWILLGSEASKSVGGH